MSGQNLTNYFLYYLKKHWFRITLVAFLLFLIFKKDFSFTINLNAPPPTETTKQPVQQAPPPKRETFTEQAGRQSMTPGPEKGVLDRFDFSSIIGSSDRELLEVLNKVDRKIVEAYVSRFGRVARSEQKKFGIPASIIIANALLHSQAGEGILSKQANNHFGLMCTPDWRGEKWDGDGECLRAYDNAWTSFRDHSFFITTGTFAELRQLDPRDYKGWAKGLEKKAYSKADNFAEQLMEVIEKYSLQELD
jgi:flagellum-specific peptidoglycan hydrolase FlgJ